MTPNLESKYPLRTPNCAEESLLYLNVIETNAVTVNPRFNMMNSKENDHSPGADTKESTLFQHMPWPSASNSPVEG